VYIGFFYLKGDYVNKIDTKYFSEKLKILSMVAEHTSNVIALIVFTEDNKLIARGNGIQIEVDFEHNLGQTFSLGIEKLTKLYSKIKRDTKLVLKDNVLEVRAGTFRSKQPLVNQESGFEIRPCKRPDSWIEAPEGLARAIDVCSISLPLKFNYTSVIDNYCFVNSALIATDERRVTLYQFDENIHPNLPFSELAGKLIRDLELNRYFINDYTIEFSNENYYIKVSRQNEPYPSLPNNLFERKFKFKANSEELLQAVEKVKLFSENPEDNSFNQIFVYISKNKIVISSQNEFGSAKEKISAEVDGTIDFQINANYLIDILKKLEGEVDFALNEIALVIKQKNFIHAIALMVKVRGV